MREAFTAIAYEAFVLVAAMAPYMLLGLAAAGVLHVLLPLGTAARHLGGPGFKPILKAVLIGVPLPICSCGVVPLAAALKKSGANNGATVSFLVSTPTTGVDSILATYSVLGGAFAALRVAASAVLGLVAGFGTAIVSGAREERVVEALPHEARRGIGERIVEVLRYAAVELFGGIARPFAFGIALGAVLSYILPAGALERAIGHGFLSYAAMMAVGIPLYVCASGSIPLAVALIAKGLSPGAALVFLIAGPATNVATIAIIAKMLGKKPLAVYLATLMLGSIAAGYTADALFAAFPTLAPTVSVAMLPCHEAIQSLGPFEIAFGTVMMGLVAYHLGRPLVSKLQGLGRTAEAAPGTVSIRVPDMNCAHCVQTIANALSTLEGVRLVSADPATKLVTIDTDAAYGKPRAAAAIREAGFHPEEPKRQ